MPVHLLLNHITIMLRAGFITIQAFISNTWVTNPVTQKKKQMLWMWGRPWLSSFKLLYFSKIKKNQQHVVDIPLVHPILPPFKAPWSSLKRSVSRPCKASGDHSDFICLWYKCKPCVTCFPKKKHQTENLNINLCNFMVSINKRTVFQNNIKEMDSD